MDRIKVWQCIGCGRIDAPQNCIGVCEYRKAEFVYASDYEEAVARAAAAQGRARVLEALVRQLAATTPRDGGWERSYRALQEQARSALAPFGERHGDARAGAAEGVNAAD